MDMEGMTEGETERGRERMRDDSGPGGGRVSGGDTSGRMRLLHPRPGLPELRQRALLVPIHPDAAVTAEGRKSWR